MRVKVVETMGNVGTAGRETEPELGGAERELVDAWGIAGEVLSSETLEWEPQPSLQSPCMW